MQSSDGLDGDAHALVKPDFRHAQEFAKLARNAGQPDSPLNIINQPAIAAYAIIYTGSGINLENPGY